MRLAWLLPDASDEVLREGWTKDAYQCRHGKPPLIVRAGRASGVALSGARNWYLRADLDDAERKSPIDSLGLNSETG
jgi:hypothetical protein